MGAEDPTVTVLLATKLGELHEALLHEYARIEQSPLHSDVPDEHPHLFGALETLVMRRTAVLREIREVLDELWWADWAETPSTMVARLQRVLDEITRIDRHERELLQSAALSELSAQD